MLSNDFNLIEIKAPFFFGLLTVPFAYGGLIGLLYWRLGVEGLIGLGIPLMSIPLQICISNMNGRILQRVNVHKDRRVQITSELIEAIKQVKMYGWEMAFRRIVSAVRSEEVAELLKLNLGRSLEFVLTVYSPYLGAFVALYIRSLSAEPTDAIIFTTIGLANFIRIYGLFFSFGFSLVVELDVIFERFATVYNMKNIQMIQINPPSMEYEI